MLDALLSFFDNDMYTVFLLDSSLLLEDNSQYIYCLECKSRINSSEEHYKVIHNKNKYKLFVVSREIK